MGCPETPREVAERIATQFYEKHSGVPSPVVEAIEAALNAERERCAKIAEREADGCGARTQQECHLKIAAAIRGKD